jgi:phosphoserine aminotransferase
VTFRVSRPRPYNFSAGPAILPEPVLREAQQDLLALPGVGLSILEISHRSPAFDAIIQSAEADMRTLAGIPGNYRILFLQGGASLQFSMVPMNLLTAGATADYIVTGGWSQKAVEEARKVGTVHIAASTEEGGFRRIPTSSELALTTDAAYAHMTSNNTLYGTQWQALPDVGDAPLVCDASSDIFSRPIDITKFGLVYAGAQKNLGPSGLTVAIVRDDLLARSADTLPSMLDYRKIARHGSLYNTGPVFAIYILRLVMKWLLEIGGLAAIEQANERKAGILYDELDRTDFWMPHAEKASRSRMNVTFRLRSSDLEPRFLKEAAAAGFEGLKGHRSVGGIRASLYNACPEASVQALVEFMREFERRAG